MKMTEFDSEGIRLGYRPEAVRVLFVGESPPAGGSFFYAANSNLWRHTQAAFGKVYRGNWTGDDGFLLFFKSIGCYLDDLCLEPVNGLSPPVRRRLRKKGVLPLAQRMRLAKPLAVVCVMQGVEANVRQALRAAEQDDLLFYSLPFPAFQHPPAYESQLQLAVEDLIEIGVLPRPS